MIERKRPGTLGSHRAGEIVLGGTLSNNTLHSEPQRSSETAGTAEQLAAQNTTTVKTCRCRYCGNEFTAKRRSASYCSEAHKKAFQRAGLAGQYLHREGCRVPTNSKTRFSAPQAVEIAGSGVPPLSILKKMGPKPPDGWRFEMVNAATIKLTDGVQERTPSSHGQWGGFNVSRAVALLTEIGWTHGRCDRWIIGCGGQSLGPLPLHMAKRAAIALATGMIKGAPPRSDPIGRLNRLSAGATSVSEELFALEENGA